MSDSFRKVTSVSWFGRIGRSLGGVVFGLLLVILMVIGLFWNEGRAVTTARSLAEGAGAVVAASADTVDPTNDGRLIHVSGPVTTDSTPADPDFGVSAEGIRLERGVEMFQWKEDSKSETTKSLGGGEETVTTYTYSRSWDDQPNDSSDFKQPNGHANPSMEIRDRAYQVPEGRLAAFTLDEPVLSRIGGDKTLALSPDQAASIRQAFGGDAKISVINGRIYLGNNPASPAVGDYRIGYDIVPLGTISVIGQQSGTAFVPYQTQAGDALLMVDTGNVPAEKMFADAVAGNTIITWILRLVGLILLAIGFGLLMGPLGVLADVIPFVGGLVRMGTGIIAFFLAILVGTATIALAWFWYRPLLALGILVVGFAIAWAIARFGKSRTAAAPTAASATSA